MMKFKTFILAALAVLVFSSCKSQFEMLLSGNDADAKYAAAFDYFNKGKYNKAGTMFESLSMLVGGTERADTVAYYWGLSNYNFKDYYTAEANFKTFLESYPRSPFASQASYLRIDCLYRSTYRYELDQSPTYKAIVEISEYIADYPETEHLDDCLAMLSELNHRLDQKAYEAAKLYYRMEDYKASRVAFRNVLKEDSENAYREDILYYTAMSSYKYAYNSIPEKRKERYLVYLDDYFNFIGEYPESHYCKELTSVYRKVQKALGRNVDIDDEEEGMSERDFEKERQNLKK